MLRTERVDALPTVLADRYEIGPTIGSGGVAIVFRAQDRKHDWPVAIKVLRPELASSIVVDRFLREIRFAAKLQHPHILPLYDSGEIGGLPYYVMPLIEGDTLRRIRCARGSARYRRLSLPAEPPFGSLNAMALLDMALVDGLVRGPATPKFEHHWLRLR
jgi:serine/threonine protein kinase